MTAEPVQKINPQGLPKPAPRTYTHIARAGNHLFIAGQLGMTADGKPVGPGMKEQLEQVYRNLEVALKSQGATFAHVTKLTTYVTNVSEYRTPEMAAIRARFVGEVPPPNTLVQIVQLADPAYKIEVEATAVLP
jgi:enamine deaminase RidA (YjgF/YER057c/UK114 family)